MEYFNLTEKVYNKTTGIACESLKIIKYDFGTIQNIYGNHSKEYIHCLCLSDTQLRSHISKFL